jgi:cytochrome b6-f complex iron-sulfur subunit
MAQQARTERTLTPRVHTRPGPEDTQGGLVREASRRDFLRLTMLGSLGVVVLGGIGAFLGFFYPKRVGTFGGKVAVPTPLTEIKDDDVVRVREGKYYLSRYKDPTTGQSMLIALYWKCAHLGCTVPWKPDETVSGNNGVFHCPCHGSVYTRTGQNIAGPAPRPLDIMQINLEGSKIVVDTGKITKRVQYETSQGTPVS